MPATKERIDYFCDHTSPPQQPDVLVQPRISRGPFRKAIQLDSPLNKKVRPFAIVINPGRALQLRLSERLAEQGVMQGRSQTCSGPAFLRAWHLETIAV